MASTLLRFVPPTGAPVRLQAPQWRLAAQPREQHIERLTRTAVVGGSYVKPLGKDPVSLNIQLIYRATERGAEHWQAPLNRVRGLQGKALELFWGELEWRSASGWYLQSLNIQYGPQANYPPDIGGANPQEGGLVFPQAQVSFNLVTEDVTVTWPIIRPSPRVLQAPTLFTP